MSDHRWTICVVTVAERGPQFARLVDILAPQVAALDGGVDVLVHWDHRESTLGQARQRLLDAAKGDYLNFIDDDDVVPAYYCDRVYPLLDGVDYIGWRQQLYVDGVPAKPTFHSLRYDRWWDDADGYYRHVSHLNPTRTDLARLGRFDRSVPEDVDWAHQVAPHLRTEHFIEDVMYEYHYSPGGSLWRQRRRNSKGRASPRRQQRPALPEHFAYV